MIEMYFTLHIFQLTSTNAEGNIIFLAWGAFLYSTEFSIHSTRLHVIDFVNVDYDELLYKLISQSFKIYATSFNQFLEISSSWDAYLIDIGQSYVYHL